MRQLSEQENKLLADLAKSFDDSSYWWFITDTKRYLVYENNSSYGTITPEGPDNICKICGATIKSQKLTLHGVWHIKQSKLGSFI